ncbi:MAG: type IV toxin-antitoxin system AbiEi family antitoxin domain-containing protein [Solirubrobacteraceae bacterium]
MRGEVRTPPATTGARGSARSGDSEIARRAAPQHGVLTRCQLLELGLDVDAIDYRLRVGRLLRLHRGVYAVGHHPPSPLAGAMAAVLACGPGGVLSHRSAAALWELDSRWRTPIEVSAPTERRHRGVRVHHSRTLIGEDVTIHFGIPVTTVARTLLDLAAVLDDKALARAVNIARLERHLRLDDLAGLLVRSPGRTTRRLRPFVDRDDAPTRSAFEDAFLAFVDRHGLPRPQVNQSVAGYEVDMLWPELRLIVELDGRAYHDSDQPFEHDRDRDADLLAAGFPVVRITWRRLIDTPAREARRLAGLLAARIAGGC